MKVRKRTRAREFALQLLYQTEFKPEMTDEDRQVFWREVRCDDVNPEEFEEIRTFALEIVRRVKENASRIDEAIRSSAENWDLSRMAFVDRNILRIGACELLCSDDIPAKVAINEAIELAKKFGDDKSSQFVNGILDRIAHHVK